MENFKLYICNHIENFKNTLNIKKIVKDGNNIPYKH